MEIADLHGCLWYITTNPIYAGAYAYGRSTHRIWLEQGRKRIVRESGKPKKIGRC